MKGFELFFYAILYTVGMILGVTGLLLLLNVILN